jgi:hypothetical protein
VSARWAKQGTSGRQSSIKTDTTRQTVCSFIIYRHLYRNGQLNSTTAAAGHYNTAR